MIKPPEPIGILALLTLVGIGAAPVLIMLLAPDFMWKGNQYELSVQLLQITFPYLFFIALVAFAGRILNAHGRFAVPALTSVFLNICMIAAAIWLAPRMDEPVIALAWGVFAAGVVQMLFQFLSWLYFRSLGGALSRHFGACVGTAILPSLSKSNAEEDQAAFFQCTGLGLRLVVLIGLSATIGLVMLAEPICRHCSNITSSASTMCVLQE